MIQVNWYELYVNEVRHNGESNERPLGRKIVQRDIAGFVAAVDLGRR
jgi:hypothetical protein